MFSRGRLACDILDEFAHHLPAACELLGLAEGDVSVYSTAHLPERPYRNYDSRDRHAGCRGLGPCPPVRLGPHHAGGYGGSFGHGLHLFENFLDAGIRYVLYKSATTHGGDWAALVVPKGKMFRLMRNWRRASHLRLPPAPVLAAGLMDGLVAETADFLRHRRKVKRLGGRLQKGLVLTGEPGNGKTMACRYLRTLCWQRRLSCAEVTAGQLSEAFAKGNLEQLMSSAQVVFFDDIDIGFFSRKSNPQMACALLNAMDGMWSSNGCVRIFTTNERLDGFDQAFMRPGRLDRVFHFPSPTRELRAALVDTWPAELKEGVDVPPLLEKTEGFSFACLESVRSNLVASLIAGRGPDLDEAVTLHLQQKNDRVGFSK